MKPRRRRPSWQVLGLCCLLAAPGCVSGDFANSLTRTNQEAAGFTEGNLALIQTAEQRAATHRIVAELLAKPLGQQEAVRLALVNSPGVQALLARNWAETSAAAQGGRLANPVVALERIRLADELEISRLLSFGLLDLLTLPARMDVAQHRIELVQIRLTLEVVEQVTRVRQAWVHAVAAAQDLDYAGQVYEAAEVSAELARRMQSAGNFTRLERVQQQAFYAEAAAQLAQARHTATAAREELIRQLGISDDQSAALKVPERLPDLPETPRPADEVSRTAASGRLDIQQALAAYNEAATAQGLTAITSLTDIEAGLKHDTVFDDAAGSHTSGRGYELALRLPLFDWGDLKREAMNARTLAAASSLESAMRAAGSSLRESYSAYRTAHDLARHYRDEVLPLRRTISEENLLRYNGMLIGVFDLLRDGRDQIRVVQATIKVQRDFWMADATLRAALVGKPMTRAQAAPDADIGADAGPDH